MTKSEMLHIRLPLLDAKWLRDSASHLGQPVTGFVQKMIAREREKRDTDDATESGMTLGLTPSEILMRHTGSMMALAAFADHAFTLRYWANASHSYATLESRAVRHELEDLAQFARYRLGICWAEIAAALRADAFSSCDASRTIEKRRFHDMMEKASQAVSNGIEWNKIFLKRETNPLVQYNLACGLSVLSMTEVERRLIEKNSRKWFSRLRVVGDAQRAEWGDIAYTPTNTTGSQLNTSTARSVPADSIGQVWRDHVSSQATAKIGGIVIQAMAELDKLLACPEPNRLTTHGRRTCDPIDASFLVDSSRTDFDLLFVRSDKLLQTDYSGWTDTWEAEDKGIEGLFNILHNNRKPSFVKQVERWRATHLPAN